jgi:hypothetical protein
MGRLRGFATGALMVILVIAIEFVGYQMDTIYSGPTPEVFGLITFATLMVAAIALKADLTALMAVFLLSTIYGIAAFLFKLDFYYHDYPESFGIFLKTIIIRAVFYSLPVVIGLGIVAVRVRWQMRSGKGSQ